MKVHNYERIYHPSIGKIVYKNTGSGLIVDNIFNPKIQYELSSGRIIQSDITLDFNNQKNKILFRWWEYLVPPIKPLYTVLEYIQVLVRVTIGFVQKRFTPFLLPHNEHRVET